MGIEGILDGLMERYRQRVPDVDYILSCMIRDRLIGTFKDIENDHIAFRTLGVPHLGIASLEKIFLHHGYVKRDYYNFTQKKLNAYWYAPPNDQFPRVFISELRVSELSQNAQDIILAKTNGIQSDPVDALDLDDTKAVDTFLHSGLWTVPTWEEFDFLRKESEYASWVMYNRYYLNHFTITVSNLPEGFNTITLFNEFLEKNGIVLNDANGKIKVSSDGLLLQSSTVAKMIQASFIDAHGQEIERPIAGSYVEFAERKPLEQFQKVPKMKLSRQHVRDGFDEGNADGIFESTYTNQTKKQR